MFNDTKVTVSGLNPVTTYRFQVFSENGVTELAVESDYLDITVTTEASVASSVNNVRVTGVKATEISLAWDIPPPPAPDAVADAGPPTDEVVEQYEVRHRTMFYSSSLLRSSVLRVNPEGWPTPIIKIKK